MSLGARARRREKGLTAVSRGLIAVNTGDTRAAAKHAAEANRLLAQRADDQALDRPGGATRRRPAGGRSRPTTPCSTITRPTASVCVDLHVEARRDGDHEAALQYAMRANARAPAAWAGQAVLDDRTRRGDWAGALATVDSNAAARLIDKPTAQRWRAVIKTAMADGNEGARPEGRDGARAGGLPGLARASFRRPRSTDASPASAATIAARPKSRSRLCANAASRSRRGLSTRASRRFDRGPARSRPLARPGRAERPRVDADRRPRRARGA